MVEPLLRSQLLILPLFRSFAATSIVAMRVRTWPFRAAITAMTHDCIPFPWLPPAPRQTSHDLTTHMCGHVLASFFGDRQQVAEPLVSPVTRDPDRCYCLLFGHDTYGVGSVGSVGLSLAATLFWSP